MPFLEDLTRKLHAMMPEMLGGQPSFPYGYAESRLGHNPIQIMPTDDYNAQYGGLGLGFTMKPVMPYGLGGKAHITVPRAAATSPYENPSSVFAPVIRHESIHAFLDPQQEKFTAHQIGDINKLIPQSALSELYGRGYSWTQASEEIPARATTDPASLQVTPEAGRQLMMKYLDILRKQDPASADRLGKYLRLSGGNRDESQSAQKPNEVF